MLEDQLIEVFEDTKSLIKNNVNYKNVSRTSKHSFSDSKFDVSVENMDAVSALIKYKISYGKVCLLNMASYKKPGGGVANGKRAQEECLFRCSNLFDVISTHLYPLKDDECIYTNSAIFIKDKDYNIMPELLSDVITIAAFNLNDGMPYDYENQTKKKIRMMVSLAKTNSVGTLILGAWGCGVFNNDPATMAKMFKEVLINEEHGSNIKIVFAIINDHNSVGNNFTEFQKAFE